MELILPARRGLGWHNAKMLSRLMVLGAALLFSTGGAAIKAVSLTGWQTAGLRSGVAGVALLLLVREARRGWKWQVAPAGVLYAATLVLFVHANKLTTSANAIFLQSTAPAYLILIGPLLLKEKLKSRDLWFALALAAGMGLFFTGVENPLATAPEPARGNVYAALSGLTYALTLASLRWMAHGRGEESGALATVTAGNLLAFLICLPQALPLGHVTGVDAGVVLYLGFVQIGLAYWLLTHGMKHVPAFEASTLLLLEPVANPVFTWLFHGEQPSGRALAGGAVIVASTLVKVWGERRSG
ncbi:MAG: EamA family transporter [Candidatus Solibacter usitatus]|nr:EamA family transporter [Acidobacteriota bacterium]MBI5282961.1 EamA family transporter [Candidatus Solibacter usitatus]